jgi:redox-sensitive bicupin YhaK (pirin superfamily)
VQRGKQDIWLTFYHNERAQLVTDNFGALLTFNEILLPTGEMSAQVKGTGVETVSYVYRGVLAQQDSAGNSGVVSAGELQHLIIGRGIRHKETNPSHTESTIIFRISLHPSEAGLDFCSRANALSGGATSQPIVCSSVSRRAEKNRFGYSRTHSFT